MPAECVSVLVSVQSLYSFSRLQDGARMKRGTDVNEGSGVKQRIGCLGGRRGCSCVSYHHPDSD